jgi:predicted TPR repeat methyltransferase
LIQVSKIERPPAALVAKLTDKFSEFFVAVQRVLVPPMKLKITKKQLIENLKSGVSMQDIAEGTGQTEAELRELLKGPDEDENESEGGYQ